jgi:hypothetical protein
MTDVEAQPHFRVLGTEHAGPEEIAAIVAVLLTRPSDAPAPPPTAARWRRPERELSFLGPRSWHQAA